MRRPSQCPACPSTLGDAQWIFPNLQDFGSPSLTTSRLMVTALPCYWILVVCLFTKLTSWFHYPLWLKGEALRQVLVNRYYGNVRPAGRRESLTTFSNGPLSAGGASKAGAGGRTCSCSSVVRVLCPARCCGSVSAWQIRWNGVFPPFWTFPLLFYEIPQERRNYPHGWGRSPARMSLLVLESPMCFNSPWGIPLQAERSIALLSVIVSAAFSSCRWEQCSSPDCSWESTLKLSRQSFLYFPDTVLGWLEFCDFALHECT